MSFWTPVVEGLGLLVLMVGLVGFCATRVSRALLPETADALEGIGVAAIMGVLGWVAVLQILGLLGVLWLPVVIAALLLLTLLSLRLLPASPRLSWGGSTVSWPVLAAAVPFAALAILEVTSGPLTSFNSYDSLHYHIVNAASILDTGSIRGLPFAQPGDNTGAEPGNASLLLLAVMLPFHNAALAGFVDLACIGVMTLIVALLMRELGRSAWSGLMAALIVITTVCFFQTQVRSAYDDVIALVGLLAGMAFGLRAARTAERRWLLVAGLCLGLAAGTKGTYVLPAAAVAAAILVVDRGWRHPLLVGAFAAAAVSLCAAWYARNWVLTGDPLFPETVRLGTFSLFSGLSGSAAAYAGVDQNLAGTLLAGAGATLTAWLRFAVFNFGLTLLAPVLCLPLAVRSRGRPRVVAILAVVCTLAYVVTPFTGSPAPSQSNGALRFLFPAVAFGVLAVSASLPPRWLRPTAGVTLGVNAVLLVRMESTAGSSVLVLLAIALSAAIWAGLRWRRALAAAARSSPVRVGTVAAAVVVALAVSAHLQPPSPVTPVDRALADAHDPEAPVVVMDVGDVSDLLGPQLEVNIVAAGVGPQGAKRPLRDPSQLTARIDALRPAAVAVGDEGLFDVIPPGWSPPSTWRRLGTEAGAVIYAP